MSSIFYKRDAFDFVIVNFPDISGNIPTVPAYGTFEFCSIKFFTRHGDRLDRKVARKKGSLKQITVET